MALEIIPVWKQVTPELKAELLAFWARNQAISDSAQAGARAEQAVCIARNDAGDVCAVATAVVRVLPRLRQPMYYYRQFFDEASRGQRQAIPFAKQAKQILQDYNAQLPAPESLGVLVEIENGMLASRYNRAYEVEADFTFIGYSPRGLMLRVSYFEGATLLPPVALPRRVAPGRVRAARPAAAAGVSNG